MGEELQKIQIIGVNKESIKSSSDQKEQWIVAFKLSEVASQAWRKYFYDVQQKDDNEMNRKARIDDDLMNVEVLAKDDLQQVLDSLKSQVLEANALCEEDYQTKIKIRQELEGLKQRQRDVTARLQGDSDKLSF